MPQHQIVFKRVGAQGEIVTVGLDIEENAGSLVDTPGHTLEAQGDCTIAEVSHFVHYRDGEVGVRLNIVKKLGVALSVERPSLVG